MRRLVEVVAFVLATVGLTLGSSAWAQQGLPIKIMPLTEEQAATTRTVPFLVHDPNNPTAPGKVLYVPTKELGDQLNDFVTRMGQSFQKVPATVGQYSVDQIELSLALTVEGSLVVVSGSAQAGIAVTFRRNQTPSTKSFK